VTSNSLWDWAYNLQAEARTRLGPKKGNQLTAYILSWSTLQEVLGHPPSEEEFIRSLHWRPLDAERSEALFREVFPQFQGPNDLLAQIKAAIDGGRMPRLFEVE
jgi:hypothetical protein